MWDWVSVCWPMELAIYSRRWMQGLAKGTVWGRMNLATPDQRLGFVCPAHLE